MATFTGNKIKDTYQSIIKAEDNTEVGSTDKIFTTPQHKLTESYITGRFG